MPIDAIDPTATGEPNNVLQVVIWGAVLLLAVLAIGIFVLVARRRILDRAEADRANAFSVEDLAAMRASGQLTDEEFRQLRAAALGVASPPPAAAEAESEVTEENDGNCPLSEAGPTDDS